MTGPTSSSITQRFRSNPVEVLVFALVCVMVGGSLLRVLTKPPSAYHAGFAPGERRMASAKRELASLREKEGTLELPCELTTGLTTERDKLRLFGMACDIPEGSSIRMLRTRIANETNQATVKAEASPGGQHFETTELPIAFGANRLVVDTFYTDGTKVSRAVQIERVGP